MVKRLVIGLIATAGGIASVVWMFADVTNEYGNNLGLEGLGLLIISPLVFAGAFFIVHASLLILVSLIQYFFDRTTFEAENLSTVICLNLLCITISTLALLNVNLLTLYFQLGATLAMLSPASFAIVTLISPNISPSLKNIANIKVLILSVVIIISIIALQYYFLTLWKYDLKHIDSVANQYGSAQIVGRSIESDCNLVSVYSLPVPDASRFLTARTSIDEIAEFTNKLSLDDFGVEGSRDLYSKSLMTLATRDFSLQQLIDSSQQPVVVIFKRIAGPQFYFDSTPYADTVIYFRQISKSANTTEDLLSVTSHDKKICYIRRGGFINIWGKFPVEFLN